MTEIDGEPLLTEEAQEALRRYRRVERAMKYLLWLIPAITVIVEFAVWKTTGNPYAMYAASIIGVASLFATIYWWIAQYKRMLRITKLGKQDGESSSGG